MGKSLAFEMKTENVAEFFETARERYEIYRRRRRGVKPPYTEDPVFRLWRFCNVFREDDKVTAWIREKVREPLRHEPGVLVAMTACRFFNRIETLERLVEAGLLQPDRVWDSRVALDTLQGVRPIVGAAYVVKTPDGMDKLNGVVAIVEMVQSEIEKIEKTAYETLEDLHTELRRIPYFGNFMAYEVVSDLRHTWMGEKARDIETWAFPGPGAARGLSWLVHGNLDGLTYGSATDKARMLYTMQHLLMIAHKAEWPRRWPKWEMREVEHWLCEYAKYVKVAHLGMRMKVKYGR